MQPYTRVLHRIPHPAGEVIESTRLLHHAHSKHHTHHEENHLDNTVLQHSRGTTLHHRIHVHELAIEDLVHNPEYAEHAQRTQERTQLGDVMEGRDKPQIRRCPRGASASRCHYVETGIIAAERHQQSILSLLFPAACAASVNVGISQAARHGSSKRQEKMSSRYSTHIPQHQYLPDYR